MLASITPLGERGRSNRWTTTVSAHLIGTVAVAVGQGALLGWVGWHVSLSASARAAVVALLAAVAVGLDLLRVRPPGLRRQVAEEWLDQYRGTVYGSAFGVQLGLGWATIVTTWLVWAALLGMLVSGSAAAGAVIGLAFGLGRGLPVLGSAGVTDGRGLRTLHRRLAAWEAPFRAAALATTAGIALVLAAVAGMASS